MFYDKDEDKCEGLADEITRNAEKVISKAIKDTRKEIAHNLLTEILSQSGKEKDFFDMSEERIAQVCGLPHKKVKDMFNEIADYVLMSDFERSMSRIAKDHEEQGREEAQIWLDDLKEKKF
ncbi:MAG: hypothetical protein IJP48_09725 [Synergistaceae bacterium]|nr:hypothetical protein [Synergistaceae bacterium]